MDRAANDREEGDLLEQKRSMQDGVFQCASRRPRACWLRVQGTVQGPVCPVLGLERALVGFLM